MNHLDELLDDKQSILYKVLNNYIEEDFLNESFFDNFNEVELRYLRNNINNNKFKDILNDHILIYMPRSVELNEMIDKKLDIIIEIKIMESLLFENYSDELFENLNTKKLEITNIIDKLKETELDFLK